MVTVADESESAEAETAAQRAADEHMGERDRFRPTITQAIVFAVALAFAASAVTAWWVNREPQPNQADIGFFDDMTSHHQQALSIAATYLKYGEDPVLGFIASGIQFGQAGDMRQFQAALQEWGEEGTPDVAMEWMGMRYPQNEQPGMATDAQLDEYEAARGKKLDDLFTKLMIDHHNGGIHMSDEAARLASLGFVRGMAEGISKVQRADINEMNVRREQLGLPRYGE
jgi:uncharacterized protein (DUF305 family)